MRFLLGRAFGFRLLLCLLLIRFRRFVAHDEKGSSCNPQSQRGVGRPRLLLGAGRSYSAGAGDYFRWKRIPPGLVQSGMENGVALKRSAVGAASYWLAVISEVIGKQARTFIASDEEFFFFRKGMHPARLRVDCRDADLHLRNHRPRETGPYLRG